MKLLSGHKIYLIRLYLKNFFIVTLIFASLVFVLNVLEEVSFFNNLNLGIYYPLLFTFLNVPSIIFEIFPFIFFEECVNPVMLLQATCKLSNQVSSDSARIC